MVQGLSGKARRRQVWLDANETVAESDKQACNCCNSTDKLIGNTTRVRHLVVSAIDYNPRVLFEVEQ